MNIYMAPMEGVTGYIFRNVFEEKFGKGRIDKYFIPFISPNKTKGYTSREMSDIAIENNVNVNAVPQIMANDYDLFMDGARMLMELGYKEINLNFGCPSGTVVSKCRGAGILSDPDLMDRFLEKIFNSHEIKDIGISVKTRIGMESAEEFEYLLTLYNQYPLKELIVHPRVRNDYYKNTPNMETFEYALNNSKNKVCYNGDIFNINDYKKLKNTYSELENVMIGRGFVGNPLLIDCINALENNECDNKCEDKKRIQDFMDELLYSYKQVLSSDVNAMHKMKEIWILMKPYFEGGDKEFKKIKKAQRVDEYKVASDMFFQNAKLKTI